MIVFPYTTDAPIYHRPWGTIGLIVVNTLAFAATGPATGPEPSALWLWYGRGLHPLQWLTSNFVHGSVSHLLGNMVFLWIFGLVVEGKTGSRLFLACYLGVGVVQSMVEQVLLLAYAGPPAASGGASAAIFGLMAMAAIWAPVNEITFFYLVGYSWMIRTGEFDVGIGLLAAVFTGLNVVEAWFGSPSSLLHLGGVCVGAPLAILLLRAGIVDCEGWDAFNVVGNGRPSHFDELEKTRESIRRTAAVRERQEASRATRRDECRRLIEAGDFLAAQAVRRSLADYDGGFPLEQDELLRLASGLCDAEAWPDAAEVMEEYLRKCPFGSEETRIELARVRAARLDDPAGALAALEPLDPEMLSPDQQALVARIAAKCRANLARRPSSG